MAETIFSKIINGEIPAKVLYDDAQILAFRDISPQGPTHVLIIPKKVIKTVDDIAVEDTELIGKMVRIAAQIAREEGIADNGYRLVFNCREQGGQEVDHLHLHLIGGRKMTWPPG